MPSATSWGHFCQRVQACYGLRRTLEMAQNGTSLSGHNIKTLLDCLYTFSSHNVPRNAVAEIDWSRMMPRDRRSAIHRESV